MTTKKHSKHAKINRRKGGQFHRHEIALIGAPCGIIDRYIHSIAAALAPIRVGYVDADHQATDIPAEVLTTQFIDKINFEQYNLQPTTDKNHWAPIFNSCDLVLVNGNHFKADRQLVLLHSKKRESLSRKLDRLTNVIGFIQEEEGLEVYDFLKEAIPHWKDLPFFSFTSAGIPSERAEGIAAHIQAQFSTPPVHGLVLNGGKSQRMGRDKGSIEYHGRPQREHLADLLSQYCNYTAISIRENKELDTNHALIRDEFLGLGPLSGLLTAFKQQPDAAWLTVACDQPALDAIVIQQLFDERDPSRLATCFHNPDTDFPEPLLTIWEPRAYPILLQWLARGYSCPRKVLINSDVQEIRVSDHRFMVNVNTPEEYAAFKTQQATAS
ncbi:MAG: NTP transferase domain-containing protein [Bacteroidota bacterium]